MAAVHLSPFAGTWYPDSPRDLTQLIRERFERSAGRTGPWHAPDALGFVVPHASPVYCGTVASAVYRALQFQQPERVVLLGFPHHGRLIGMATTDASVIATPLGEVTLERVPGFPVIAEDRLCDHSFEIQLPFLQTAVPNARIAPLYAGTMTAGERREAAARLAAVWKPGTVFLASSDLTHYGRNFGFTPFPADANAARRLHELDFRCIDAAGSIESALFLETLGDTKATICGAEPIALLLEVLSLLASDVYQHVLDYQTSAEVSGDYRHSVSYGALAYHRRCAFDLDAVDGTALLDSAAGTLQGFAASGRREALTASGSPALESRRGIFVSLHHGAELLGCVGNWRPSEPLSVAAGKLALAAALDDPRFTPAAALATATPDIEISILTPMRQIRNAGCLQVGRHGAMLRLGAHSGLLLPQVAKERGWGAEDLLAAIARKSGLSDQAWRDPQARLFEFEAQVFSRPGLRAQS